MRVGPGRLAVVAVLALLLLASPVAASAESAAGAKSASAAKTFYTLVVVPQPPCSNAKPQAVLLNTVKGELKALEAGIKAVGGGADLGVAVFNVTVNAEQEPKGLLLVTLACGKEHYGFIATPVWGGFTAAQPLWLLKAYEEASRQLEELRATLRELGQNVTRINESLSNAVRGLNASLAAKTTALNSTLVGLAKSLNKTVKSLGANVTRLEKLLGKTMRAVGEVRDAVQRLGEELRSVNESLASRIDALSGNVSAEIKGLNETIVSELRRAVVKLSEAVSTKTSVIESAVNRLNRSIASLSGGVQGLQSHVEALGGRMSRSETLTVAVLGLVVVNIVLLALLWRSVRCSVEELQ